LSWTYQLGANPQIDYPRLLIGDTDPANQIFQDSEILAAYNIVNVFAIVPSGGGQTVINSSYTPSYYRVAAILLDALAGFKSRLAAQLKVLDIELNVTDAARELRATAKEYRDIEDNSGAFAIVEMVPNDFAAYERVWKQLLRLGV
jgi:hypothetical protein